MKPALKKRLALRNIKSPPPRDVIDGFSLIEFLIAHHPKLQQGKAIRGFTLIELLVVIAIIAILVTIAIASFTSAQAKGRDARRKGDLDAIKIALQMYYNDNNAYPSTGGGWYSPCNNPPYWQSNKTSSGPTGWIPNLAPTYIKVLPLDPKRGTSTDAMENKGRVNVDVFCYVYKSDDGTDYKVAVYCGIEGQAINTSDFWYKGNLSWGCDNYPSANFSNDYAIWTQGAQGW